MANDILLSSIQAILQANKHPSYDLIEDLDE